MKIMNHMINLRIVSVLKSKIMTIKNITIASRESPLAMWQAEHIKYKIIKLYPDIEINIKGFKTQGDTLINQSLATIGGKGLIY